MGTLVDKLMKADAKKAGDLKKDTYSSKKLAEILGEEEKVEITIREIPSRRINDLSTYQYDRKGNMDYSKNFDAKLMTCVEGIIEPNLRDKELQAHFKCKTANELCEKLFGFEVNYISDAIMRLSDVEEDAEKDTEEEIKN
ncbi:MAG: hypothetical protein HFJ09_05445 [Lachnospiraceae bacterium]|nr:hypothetical protein [Lachnospiraceae bacterium]